MVARVVTGMKGRNIGKGVEDEQDGRTMRGYGDVSTRFW